MDANSSIHYTIDDLMRVCTECTVSMRGQTRTYYLRVVTQRGEDARRNYAVGASRQLFADIKNTESDTFRTYFSSLPYLSRERLEESLINLKTGEFVHESIREINAASTPEPPSDPTIRDIVENEEDNQQIRKDVEAERMQWVEAQLAAYKPTLAQLSEAELIAEIERLQIDALMNEAYIRAFNDATLYWAVFTDPGYTKRLFANPMEASDCDPVLYDKLRDAYLKLDVFSRDLDGLKN